MAEQVVLVTGASRGIGRAVACSFALRGHRVIGTATSAAGADAIREALADGAAPGAGVVLDVGDQGSVDALFAGLAAEGDLPGVLVNNAGIARDGLLVRMKPEMWDEVISVNLGGIYRMCRAALRPMMRARAGRIINLTSVIGMVGNPGQTNYAAAKAGIAGFSKALAREVASRGITVNTVAPGFIDTDMTRDLPDERRTRLRSEIPLGRFGSPEDVASVIAFLASPEAGYITGETIHVNGGMYMP